MDRKTSSGATLNPVFERKIWRARLAAAFEHVWLRLWLVLAVLCLFLLVSFAGVWPYLGFWSHLALLSLFAAALVAAVAYVLRFEWPSREDGIRRIEAVSGVPHRPVSTYEDTLTGGADDPTTRAIWQAHRARMAALFARLKSGEPHPRTDRFDPMALRAGLVLLAAVLTLVMGDRAADRIASAFTFPASTALAEARLDAWITPPPYTSRPPVMLTDGATGSRQQAAGSDEADHAGPPDVPQKSVLIVRAGGMGGSGLSIEITPAGSKDTTSVERREPEATKSGSGDVQEIRYELVRTSTIRALAGGTELATWLINVTPDKVPMISLSKPPELTPRGSLKFTYKAEDDYGVASAKVKLERVKEPAPDPAKEWAKPERPTGPRPPLQRPPELPLKLPKVNAKSVDGHTYFDFASHPWAGRKVIVTLEATDVAGQTGHSPSFEMILPERNFTKPLARAVAEQRRRLLDDPRYRGSVTKAVDALTLEPDGFIDDLRVYLGLRTVYYRLEQDRTRAGMKSVTDQLWQIALRIEDGSLSDAERALKDAQDKLSKALENGASEEEIKQLMAELRQAFNEFMKQLAQQGGQEQQQGEGQDQQNQVLGQEDLERMMRNLEEMAKNGSREQAQQMLSEMQDLMERMQAGRMDQAQQQRNQEMLQMMDELGNMVGDQQKLLDDTFSENRDQGDEQDGQQGEGQRPPPGMKGMGGDGQEGRNGAPPGQSDKQQGRGGQRGQGGKAQQGQGDQMGQGQQQGGKGQLTQRQRELRDRLGKLQQQMREKGAGGGSPNQLSEAEKAMEDAGDALERGDLDEATEQQGRALEQMRQGAQSMAQEMMRNMPQRYGQSGDTPRDPLGRPQKSQGPDLGTSVKVPDQIDIQRAREILEELRRRLGDATRVPTELDYLERLLRRF